MGIEDERGTEVPKRYNHLTDVEKRRLIKHIRDELAQYARTGDLECVSQGEALCDRFGWTRGALDRVIGESLEAEERDLRTRLLSSYGSQKFGLEIEDLNRDRPVDWDRARAYRDARVGQVEMLLSEFASRHPEWRVDIDVDPEGVGIELICSIKPEGRPRRATVYDPIVKGMVCVEVKRQELEVLRNAIRGIAERAELRLKRHRDQTRIDNVPCFRLFPNYDNFRLGGKE